MKKKDDTKARKARADRLREQIRELNSPEPPSSKHTSHSHEPESLSPREFIERRMAEFDREEP